MSLFLYAFPSHSRFVSLCISLSASVSVCIYLSVSMCLFPSLSQAVSVYLSLSKSALDLPHAQVDVPYTDFKHLINQYIFSTWKDDWNGAVANKLHSVKPVLGDWQSSYRRCRKDEVVLCHAHIGHTYMTHSYILKKDPPPV